MEKAYRLEIITPLGVEYTEDVVHARIPTENGSVGVLANHAPYVTSSEGGTCLIREQNGHEKRFLVGEGFFSVAGNEASFLTQKFEDLKR